MTFSGFAPSGPEGGKKVFEVGSVPHLPVLSREVLHFLSVRPDGLYVDATVGAGGHAAAIAERLTAGSLVGIDRDETALALSGERLGPFGERVRLVHAAFSEVTGVLDRLHVDRVDGVLADLGVSSMQLDEAERGFSFFSDALLDMRMDRSEGETAARFLSRVREKDLVRIIGFLGEERYAGRIARRIVEERVRGFVFTGGNLRRLIHESIPRSGRTKSAIDPATRTFMGLRIALNREIEELETFLDSVIGRVKPGGRIVVIAFHSLEDRIVKTRFRNWASPRQAAGSKRWPEAPDAPAVQARILTRKPVRPSVEEAEGNPRSRSARLRAVEVL